jgi:hypothetical protein
VDYAFVVGVPVLLVAAVIVGIYGGFALRRAQAKKARPVERARQAFEEMTPGEREEFLSWLEDRI